MSFSTLVAKSNLLRVGKDVRLMKKVVTSASMLSHGPGIHHAASYRKLDGDGSMTPGSRIELPLTPENDEYFAERAP